MASWAEKAKDLDQRLRLRGRPIAIKFLEKAEDVHSIPRLRKLEGKLTTCQRFYLARMAGFTMAETALDSPPWCTYIMGLSEMPPEVASGEMTAGVWCQNQEEARKRIESFPIIPPGKYEAMLISPLERERFEPEVVLIYGTPPQITLILSGLQFHKYQKRNFLYTGGSSCAVSVANCFLTQEPCLAIPDYGERRYGHALEDELMLALPAKDIETALAGLEGLAKAGLTYPPVFFGAQADPYFAFPTHYRDVYDREIAKAAKKSQKKK